MLRTIIILLWSLVFIATSQAMRGTNLSSLRFSREKRGSASDVIGRTFCDGTSNGDMEKTRVDTGERVQNLIKQMKIKKLDAYIIPTADQHLSAYVADYEKRRGYISGFQGSAGTAVVLSNGIRSLWTDGRYFLQADQELDCKWNLMKAGLPEVPSIVDWLISTLKAGAKVGADPKLISSVTWIEDQKKLDKSSIQLVSIDTNLVDEIWPENERPPLPKNPIQILGLKYTGKKWEEKIEDLRADMEKQKIDIVLVTAMDEVAWLFNLRGYDVPYTPVFRSYAIIDKEKIRLFLDASIRPEIDLHLRVNECEELCVEILGYEMIVPQIRALTSRREVKSVLVPARHSYSGGASYAIYSAVVKEKVLSETSPILLMKAKKNKIESVGMRNAHLRDAVALIDFMSLLDKEISEGIEWDEVSAAKKLEDMRGEQVDFFSPSFETISAFGSNGAVIHYRPSLETNKVINNQSLYLLDSGGQYKDGTTDVTRTMHYGEPTEFQKEMYTRVLKGAVDVAMAIFPKNTKDTRVDILARKSLFEVGLDYAHGTGHGIGMFLSVHEAPTQMRIGGKEEHDLEVGHFFSDEPGYYKPGEFGIRLETILTVVPVKPKYDERNMLGLLPVTLVPFEPKLINIALLNRKQCDYINKYHTQIRKVVGREIHKQNRQRGFDYLMKKTEPLECSQAGTEDSAAILQIFENHYSDFEFTSLHENEGEIHPEGIPPLQQQSIRSGEVHKHFSFYLMLICLLISYM